MHFRNIAERSIFNFKDHFKAVRSACDLKFPKHLWCQLIPQANITLNILRQARLHLQPSTYKVMWGAFDYNQTPLPPPGTRILVREMPKQ